MTESRIPNHIAIIMDGNGRWATKRGKPRLFGHRAGIESLKRTIFACLDFKIKVLSIFAFSTENWKRPKEEVDGIFNLVEEFTEDSFKPFMDNGVKIRTMGDLSKLPDKLKNLLLDLTEKTKHNENLILNIGINYGGRAEIVRAVNKVIESGAKECTEQDIINNLYTYDLPDPDLIIRASGENRISNFMLFQCAYSEFYFPKVHWPDFNKKQIQKAINAYQKRNRRFGGLK